MNKEKHKQIALGSIFATLAITLLIGSFIELFREFGSLGDFIPRWLIIVLPTSLFVVLSSTAVIVLYYYFRLLLKSTIASVTLMFLWIAVLLLLWKFGLIEYGLVILVPLIVYEILCFYYLKTDKSIV